MAEGYQGWLAEGHVYRFPHWLENGRLVTAGGRVLTVCAHGASFAEAREKAYRDAARVRFEGAHFRTDIGFQAMR